MASIFEPEIGHGAIGHLGSIGKVMELTRNDSTKIRRFEASFDAELLQLRQLFQPTFSATQIHFRDAVVPTEFLSTEVLEKNLGREVERGHEAERIVD